MRNRSRLLANLASVLVLSTCGALAAPAVAPLAAQPPAKAATAVKSESKPAAHAAPKRAAVRNADALDLGGEARLVDNYELGASVGGSDVPRSSEMDQEIEGIVNKITKPPGPKKGIAPPAAKVPETALPRKSREPAPAPQKSVPPSPIQPEHAAPQRSAPPAVPSGETGATTDHAMIALTSPLSASISKIELAALAAMMFPRPAWRKRPAPADSAAYFDLPRGI